MDRYGSDGCYFAGSMSDVDSHGRAHSDGSGPVSLLVCGGAVVDCIVRPFDSQQHGASRTSMPGEARISHGGVGRNLAEVSLRLGCAVHLLSAVGGDEPGRQLLSHCRQLGILVEDVAVLDTFRTATYTALLDGTGELVGAVADMAILDNIQPEILRHRCGSLDGIKLVLCEANLSSEALKAALQAASGNKTCMWFDPVSVAKAPRGVQSIPWHLAAPNWDELLAMLGWRSQGSIEWSEAPEAPEAPALPPAVIEAVAEALVPGFGFAKNLLLTLGPKGCVLATQTDADAMSTKFGKPRILQKVELDVAELLQLQDDKPIQQLPGLSVEVSEQNHSDCTLRWYRLKPLDHVRDVTGAGDALLAGTAAAFVEGWTLPDSIFLGLICAHATLFVDGSIAQDLGPNILPKLAQLLPQLHGRHEISSRL